MKKTIALIATTLLALSAHSGTINVDNLLDDPSFLARPDASMPTGGTDTFKYSGTVGNKVVLYTTIATSTASDASSFTAPINIFDDATVTDDPAFASSTAKLTAITPNFVATDTTYFNSAANLIGTAQEINAFYKITLVTTSGSNVATSATANLFDGSSSSVIDMETKVRTAWNSISWDIDPFASGGVAYQNIESIGIEWFHHTVVANTNADTYFILENATIGYTAEVIASTPQAPIASADAYEVDENSLFTHAAPGVLANDSDVNGDPMEATLVSSPTHGTLLSFSSNGAFVYQPNTDFIGTDSFTYEVSDGGLTGNVATVTLSVSGTPTTLPHIFQDNMVLQRNKPITVWGWGAIGKTVSVSLSSGQSDKAVIDANGRWEVTLSTMAATNGPLTLVASAHGSTVTRTNIAVGDVWFCSGQSNAGWQLAATDGGPEEVATANYPNYRLIRVPRWALTEPTDDPLVLEESLDWDAEDGEMNAKAGAWFVCSPETAGNFGAVFYYTGKAVHLELGIPVGIIQSAYAGTPTEAWSKSILPDGHPIGADPADPHTLWNGMVYPYLRMGITGACWYQGERNHDDGGHIYAEKLPVMVNDWRTGFAQGDFPFYYIQIPRQKPIQCCPISGKPRPWFQIFAPTPIWLSAATPRPAIYTRKTSAPSASGWGVAF